MEKEMQRAKRQTIVVFGVFFVFFSAILISCFVYKYQHTFSQEKWSKDIDDRYKIVNDMLNKVQLVGMREADVIQLLGDEDSEKTSFKRSKNIFPPESTLVYYLGCDFMDDNWLIFSIKNGKVSEYCIDFS